jgi:hypothetical protein
MAVSKNNLKLLKRKFVGKFSVSILIPQKIILLAPLISTLPFSGLEV